MLLPSLAILLGGSLVPHTTPRIEGAPPQPAGAPATTPLQDEADTEDEPAPLVITPSTFADGMSRAERLERFLVVLWTRKDEARTDELVESILGDTEVRRWVDEHAVVVSVDVQKNRFEANANHVRLLQVPSLDIVRSTDGARLERLVVGATSTDFLAAVLGSGAEGTVERPVGNAAVEPFRWLAWGNQRFVQGDPEAGKDATEAYRWLLTTSEAYRPGFRARFLEYLIRRLNQNKRRDPGSFITLRDELRGLRSTLLAGTATRRDVYEFGRFADWLEQDEYVRETYKALGETNEHREPSPQVTARRARARAQLLDVALPILGRHGEYEEALDGFAVAPLEHFQRRFAALERAQAAAAKALESAADGAGDEATETGETEPPVSDPDFDALPFAIPDDVRDLVLDASWTFEALLSTGRTDEARALFEGLAGGLPGIALYAEFANHAIRLEAFDLAAEILDLGSALSAKGDPPRLQRIRGRLARAIEEARARARAEEAETESEDAGDGKGGRKDG